MRFGSFRSQLLIIRLINTSNRASPCYYGGCNHYSSHRYDLSTYYSDTNNCRRNHDRHHDRSCHSAPDHKSTEQNNTRYTAACNDGPYNTRSTAACNDGPYNTRSNFPARSHYTSNNTSNIFESRRL
jgi:hypothetical protein